jgi:hypothetical protein
MALSLIIQRRLTPQMGGLVCSGITGRFAPDWVADLDRNQWPVWTGILTKLLQEMIWLVFRRIYEDKTDEEYEQIQKKIFDEFFEKQNKAKNAKVKKVDK